MSSNSDSLIEQFCCITGVGKVEAAALLEACNYDLQVAVNMQMEGLTPQSSGASTSSSTSYNGADDVRAPIPQKQEVLVSGPDEFSFSLRGRRRATKSVFDKFRDFEAEAKRQEEELLDDDDDESSTTWKPFKQSSSRQKKKTLEDLFRPPVDLMFKGTFQAARDKGISDKKWLLVNVQDSSEFPCQVLNRDVWSNTAVRTIVKEHFIFWQIYHDSEEGQRYMMFYKITEWPYVAIVDPRTGECLASWHKLDAVTFCDVITEFLSSHTNINDSLTEDTASPVRKKPRMETGESILEADEAAQIEAAIKASLEDHNKDNDDPYQGAKGSEDVEECNSDTLETFDSDSEDIDYSIKNTTTTSSTNNIAKPKYINSVNKSNNGECTSNAVCTYNGTVHKEKEQQQQHQQQEDEDDQKWKKYLGSDSDEKSDLMLRLPDGSKELVSFPCSSKLMALILYVAGKGYSNESYELVTNFPRRKISYLNFDISLKEAGLFPKESIFVQSR